MFKDTEYRDSFIFCLCFLKDLPIAQQKLRSDILTTVSFLQKKYGKFIFLMKS